MITYHVRKDMGNWYLLNNLFPVQNQILYSPVEPIFVVDIVLVVEALSLFGVKGSLFATVLSLSEGLIVSVYPLLS